MWGKTENRLFYEPSLTHKEGSRDKRGRYLDSSHKVSQYLFLHSKTLKARLKEIRGKKHKISYFMTPSLTHGGGGGPGVNLTSYLDSSHMVSQYLFLHSKAVKARIKEIKGQNTKSTILWPQFDP